MKNLISFIFCFFCVSISAKDIGHSEGDTISCMRQIVCDSLAFKGKLVRAVFDKFKEEGISIQSLTLGGTSAWVDPDGESYINRIIITYLSREETTRRLFQERPFAKVVIYVDGPKMTIEEAMERYCIRNRRISTATKLELIRNDFGVKHLHFVFMFSKAASLPKDFYDWQSK